jgi:hypothetical protein
MEKIDEINQYYIKNINLDPDSYTNYNIYDLSSIKDIIKIIGESLDKSMNSNDPTKKLDYVLIAYSNINLLIEDFSGNRCVKRRKIYIHTLIRNIHNRTYSQPIFPPVKSNKAYNPKRMFLDPSLFPLHIFCTARNPKTNPKIITNK